MVSTTQPCVLSNNLQGKKIIAIKNQTRLQHTITNARVKYQCCACLFIGGAIVVRRASTDQLNIYHSQF